MQWLHGEPIDMQYTRQWFACVSLPVFSARRSRSAGKTGPDITRDTMQCLSTHCMKLMIIIMFPNLASTAMLPLASNRKVQVRQLTS